MGELMKRVEEIKVDTEEQAQALIDQAKEDPHNEGYELKAWQSTKKEKKSKGEIIDEYWIVKLTKVW